jgi:type III restriction enzyme
VQAEYRPAQMVLDGIGDVPDIAAIVKTTTSAVVQQTISIPRIITVPRDEVKSGFKPFTLDFSALRLQAPSQELWVQHLRTRETETIQAGGGGIREERLENYVVRALIDFDDISYDNHADLLFDLAEQAATHFRSYLSEDGVWKLFEVDAKRIAENIHAQMQGHYWEEIAVYDAVVKRGFVELKQPAYTKTGDYLDFRQAPADKSNMSRYIFTGFKRCLYAEQKFDSNTERMLAVILDREAEKWFRPARGQFQISYRWKHSVSDYHPDFVAETADTIYLIEPKMVREMDESEVLEKAGAAKRWCEAATEHAASHSGKPWAYVRIPHDQIAENVSLNMLVQLYG